MKNVLILATALTMASSAIAQEVTIPRCSWESVATKFSVNPYMLYAIATTESGLRPNIVSAKNANGTYDIGLMQINSSWLPTLRRHGITEASLKDPCTNLEVGAWILASNMQRHGNTWKAVGAYNASTPSKQVVYAKKVLRNIPREAHYAQAND